LSTSEEIATVYHSDINRAAKTVRNRPDGYLHFLSGLTGMQVQTLYPKEWMERLRELCANENIKVGCELPGRLSGRRDSGDKGTFSGRGRGNK